MPAGYFNLSLHCGDYSQNSAIYNKHICNVVLVQREREREREKIRLLYHVMLSTQVITVKVLMSLSYLLDKAVRDQQIIHHPLSNQPSLPCFSVI